MPQISTAAATDRLQISLANEVSMESHNTIVLGKSNTNVLCLSNTFVLDYRAMKYGDRLRLAREHKGLSQDDLVGISGVKQGTISKIERGDQNSSGFDAELSYALDVHAMWLKKGYKHLAPPWLGGNYVSDNAVNESRLSLSGHTDKITAPEVRMVPVLALDRAAEWEAQLKDHPQGEGAIMLQQPIEGKDLFIVPIPDNSMEPRFINNGDEGVIIDPHMPRRHGLFVLVQAGGRAILRQLFDDQGEWWLEPLNSDYKRKLLGDGVIIGVVRRKVIVTVEDFC